MRFDDTYDIKINSKRYIPLKYTNSRVAVKISMARTNFTSKGKRTYFSLCFLVESQMVDNVKIIGINATEAIHADNNEAYMTELDVIVETYS
jgi:hypothetical protein